MGQSCTRGGGVAEDGKGNKEATPFGRGNGKSTKASSSKADVGGSSSVEDQPRERTPPPQLFSVVTKIEALQHTMRPAVAVVPRGDLHPEFRQFTPLFTEGYAALSVASCQNAGFAQQVIMTGEDCSIAQFSYETGHVMRRWVRAHDKEINQVTRPTSTGLFATCSRDCVVKVWNLNRDIPLATLTGHTVNAVSVDVDDSGAFAMSGGKDSTVRLWDIGRSEELYCAGMKENIVTFVRYVPHLNLIAQGGEDLTVRLWDVRVPPSAPAVTLRQDLTDADHIPLCCDISPLAPTRLLTGHGGSGGDGSYLQEWDLRAGENVRMYKGHEASVTSLRMSKATLYGQNAFFTTSDDGTIGYWSLEDEDSKVNIATLPIEHQFRVPEGAMTCCECDNNGDVIVTLRSGAAVVFRPVREGRTILPAKRFRYIGPMDAGKSLAA